MYPPSQSMSLDIEALSGICGSISIACWVVVFSPQILENFQRSSADGLSVVFIAVWLLGDVFNILGAVLQGVIPTMTILAVYYTFADLVLLGQCFYYKGFTLSDAVPKPGPNVENGSSNEESPLLRNGEASQRESNGNGTPHPLSDGQLTRTYSGESFRERYLSIDGTHLSPVTPLREDPKPGALATPPVAHSTLRNVVFNLVIIILVCFSGVLGWWLSNRNAHPSQGVDDSPPQEDREVLSFNILGQVFGYICAVLYLGSRIPQLLLNYRRKSTEGISMLFFLFACIGNFTYVMSIFAYNPGPSCEVSMHCREGEAGSVYGKYIAVNLSWIIGSFGTLLLDAGVFVQYFMYKGDNESDSEEAIEEAVTDAPEAEIRRERRRRRSVTFAD